MLTRPSRSKGELAAAVAKNVENAGGGIIRRGAERFTVRTDARVMTAEQIAAIPVKFAGGVLPLQVRDLASVVTDAAPRQGAATQNGRETVLGTVMMLVGQNSRETALRVQEALPGISFEVKDRIIRTFVRRVQGLAFNARAYELMWVLLVARLLKLLTRVGELVLYRKDPAPDLATTAPQMSTAEIVAEVAGRLGLPEDHRTVLQTTHSREYQDTLNELARRAGESRRLVLKPRLADLAYALKEDPNAPCYSWAEAWGEIDAENASDDDNSSIRSSDLPPDSDLD